MFYEGILNEEWFKMSKALLFKIRCLFRTRSLDIFAPDLGCYKVWKSKKSIQPLARKKGWKGVE